MIKKITISILLFLALAAIIIKHQIVSKSLDSSDSGSGSFTIQFPKTTTDSCNELVVISRTSPTKNMEVQILSVICDSDGVVYKFRVNIYKNGRVVKRQTVDFIELYPPEKEINETSFEINFKGNKTIIVKHYINFVLPLGDHGDFILKNGVLKR